MTEEIRNITSISDFKADVDLIAEIKTLTGITYNIPIRKIPLDEWNAVGKEVPGPDKTNYIKGASKDGKYIYDLENPKYLAEQEAAVEERAYRRLLACLRVDVPGRTLAKKIETLRQDMPADVLRALFGYVERLHVWRQPVQARAESFLGTGSGDDADITGDGLDESAMDDANE